MIYLVGPVWPDQNPRRLRSEVPVPSLPFDLQGSSGAARFFIDCLDELGHLQEFVLIWIADGTELSVTRYYFIVLRRCHNYYLLFEETERTNVVAV